MLLEATIIRILCAKNCEYWFISYRRLKYRTFFETQYSTVVAVVIVVVAAAAAAQSIRHRNIKSLEGAEQLNSHASTSA